MPHKTTIPSTRYMCVYTERINANEIGVQNVKNFLKCYPFKIYYIKSIFCLNHFFKIVYQSDNHVFVVSMPKSNKMFFK